MLRLCSFHGVLPENDNMNVASRFITTTIYKLVSVGFHCCPESFDKALSNPEVDLPERCLQIGLFTRLFRFRFFWKAPFVRQTQFIRLAFCSPTSNNSRPFQYPKIGPEQRMIGILAILKSASSITSCLNF